MSPTQGFPLSFHRVSMGFRIVWKGFRKFPWVPNTIIFSSFRWHVPAGPVRQSKGFHWVSTGFPWVSASRGRVFAGLHGCQTHDLCPNLDGMCQQVLVAKPKGFHWVSAGFPWVSASSVRVSAGFRECKTHYISSHLGGRNSSFYKIKAHHGSLSYSALTKSRSVTRIVATSPFLCVILEFYRGQLLCALLEFYRVPAAVLCL